MVIPSAPQIEGGCLNATEFYFRDGKNAAPGEECGPKVAFLGQLNGIEDNWQSTVNEMDALGKVYQGTGKRYRHYSVNLMPGEGPWTREKAHEAVQIFLKHQGLEGQPCIYSVHKDKPHSHIHVYTCEVRPESNAQGVYELINSGSSCDTPKGINRVEAAHKAEAEIRARQGWARVEGARWDMTPEGEFIRAKKAPVDPVKANQVNIGKKLVGWEHRNGQPHPKRILGETARDIIQAAGKDKAQAVAALAAAGITYTDTMKGGRPGGLLTSEACPDGIKLSSLPKDCRWLPRAKAKDKPEGPIFPSKIDTFSDAKNYIKHLVKTTETGTELFQGLTEKGLKYEQVGKAGVRIRFAPGATGAIKLSEAGTSFSRLVEKYGDISTFNQSHASSVNVNEFENKIHVSLEIIHGTGGSNASLIQETSMPAPLPGDQDLHGGYPVENAGASHRMGWRHRHVHGFVRIHD